MTTEQEPPRFKHDCARCTYLGRYAGTYFGKYEEGDLYHCTQHTFPTVIARFSDRPQDYSSGMLLARDDPRLGEALKRARERGLVAAEPTVHWLANRFCQSSACGVARGPDVKITMHVRETNCEACLEAFRVHDPLPRGAG